MKYINAVKFMLIFWIICNIIFLTEINHKSEELKYIMTAADDKDFIIKRIRNQNESDAGINDVYELIYILRGHKKYFINNSLFRLSVGDVCLISQGDIRSDRTEQASDAEYITMKISSKYLQEISDITGISSISNIFEAKKISIPVLQHYSFDTLIDTIYMEYINSTYMYSTSYLRLLFGELLIRLSRCMPENTATENLSSHDGRICEVCRHICNYYNESLNLNDMAKLSIMSPTYFSKKFKKVTGFGFNEYLNNVRMKIAMNMLTQTNHSINDIAVFCGYQDANYFGDVFRRVVGMSPSKYRKTHPRIL